MSDTQWPRYEVFKQDNLKKPHESIGSVHAPDPEMALLNARDVFVRRPSAISLWVVPETAVFSLTAEEIALQPDWYELAIQKHEARPTDKETFCIFTKTSQRRSMTFVKHVGEIEAETAVAALKQAIDSGQFGDKEIFVWWTVPENSITRSDDDDIASLFEPAHDKIYRQQAYYHRR